MIQLIKKIDSSLLGIQPIVEYLRQFEKCEIINEDIEVDNSEINILFENELIKILYIKISMGRWLSIYRYHSDGMKYEQTDLMLFDETKKNEYNSIIKFSGHVEDDNYSYITCSCFSYLDNYLIRGWRQARVVPVQDLCEIQYSKDMNLTELICMTDDKSKNIIKKEEQGDIKTLVLKLEKL